jgi:hypothetical protein
MMIRVLANVLLLAGPLLGMSQNTANNAYAITSKVIGGVQWTEVKQISLDNGSVVKSIFDKNVPAYNVFDGRSARSVAFMMRNDSASDSQKQPFAGLSAACAYDRKQNRLYFAPLFINQLRYMDLNGSVPSVYLFQHENFVETSDIESEANQVTRMVIAADGNGYAMSNDGMHLVTFTTGKNPVISDLGAVTDAPENGEISIHDANTSWGGDMLADASGNLYVISALNHVFKIDMQTRIATFISKIKELPEGFTTNGAVVDEKGKIVLSSANYLTAYYSVDPESWQATAITSNEQLYNTSDLANERLLFETELKKDEQMVVQEKISVFPNPVKNSSFRITFQNKESGKYNVQLIDVAGRMVSDKSVTVYDGYQTSEVRISSSLSKGMYMVKVLNNDSKEIYLKKILVQ